MSGVSEWRAWSSGVADSEIADCRLFYRQALFLLHLE